MKEVIVYSTDYCPYCVRAKQLLKSKEVEYKEINVDTYPEEKAIMIQKSNGARTVPQILIDDFHVGGCDELYALDGQGKLNELLETKLQEQDMIHKKVIVLGSGPAGYTAAIYAARANLAPLMLTGNQKGGQLTTTTEVENFPGFPQGVDGNDLMTKMEAQATRFETEIIFGEVTNVDLSSRPFKLEQDNNIYTCDVLIIATGASARYLGLESETKYKNRGVSACATCDGFFYKGKKVAVNGGGDTALEEAHYLTNFCEKVFLIHRRDEFRASKAMQKRILANDKIEVVWDSVVDEVIGDDRGMTDLQVRNVKTGEKQKLGTEGLFVAIGHTPNTKLFKGVLDMDETGYLITTPNSTHMNIEGVFACGDAMDKRYRQAVTAAGSGCMAAIDAERWLAEQE
jgi:thioredoxin reductase (NADPH)